MRNQTLWLLIVVLLLATGLRVWQLDTQSIWFDEGFSWHAASQSSLAATVNGDPTNPPLYYLLLHIWLRLVGDSEFGLRALSLLQGILLLAGSASLAKRHFGSDAAVLASILGAFSPLLWWASQEARMYNTLALAALLITTGYVEIQRQPRTRWAWFALAIGELGALYTHNTGIVFLGGLNLAFGVRWLVLAWRKPAQWSLLMHWTGSQLGVLVLWLPELLARFRNLGGANAALNTPPELSPVLVWQSWQALWASSWEMVLSNPALLQAGTVIMAIVALPGIFALRGRAGREIASLLLALYFVLIAALAVLGVHLHGRYLVALTPLILILIAAGLNEVPWPRWRAFARMAAALVAAGIWLCLPGQMNPAFQHDQAREIMHYYTQRLGADDRVLTWSYAERYELLYYARKMGLQAQLITLPEGANLADITTILNGAFSETQPVRAEINTWYTQASDRRGMLPCLIGNNHPPAFETFTVQGMTTRGYLVTPPLRIPPLEVSSANFGSIAVTAVGMPAGPVEGDRGFCIPVMITQQTTLDDNLNVAVRLLNPNGQEIASADAPLLTASQAPTRMLGPGDTASAFPLLYLPQGTPPGEYPLELSIYGANHPTGLDLLDPTTGAPAGKDMLVGPLALGPTTWPPFQADCALQIGEQVALTNCAALEAGTTLQAGTPLAPTLALQVNEAPLTMIIRLLGDSWETSDTVEISSEGAVLAWPILHIPPDARDTGHLVAQVIDQEAVELAQYFIVYNEHRMDPPTTGTRNGKRFGTLGTLYGFTLEQASLTSGTPVDVTLVWQAENTQPIPYAVTVQLLSAEGVLLAQHDGQPAGGSRPTTGWVANEYIEDIHQLEFREEHLGYTGEGRLIVALYDPATGVRVLTEDGADYVVLINAIGITPQ